VSKTAKELEHEREIQMEKRAGEDRERLGEERESTIDESTISNETNSFRRNTFAVDDKQEDLMPSTSSHDFLRSNLRMGCYVIKSDCGLI